MNRTRGARRPRPARAWIGAASRAIRVAAFVQASVVVATVLQLTLAAAALARIVDGATGPAFELLAGLVVLTLFRAGARWWAEVLTTHAETQARRILRQRLYRAILTVGPFGNRIETDSARRSVLTEGAQAVAFYFARYLSAGTTAIVAVTAVTLVLMASDPLVGTVAVLGTIASQVIPLLWLGLVGGPSYETLDTLAHSNRVFVDNVQGLPTAKAFNAVAARRRILADEAEKLRRESMAVLRLGLSWIGLAGLLTFATLAGATFTGIVRWQSGDATVLTPILALLTLPVAFAALTRFGGNRHAAMDAQQAVAPIESILDAAAHAATAEAGGATPPPVGDLVVENVTFAYPGRDEAALTDLSLTLKPGSTTAIVGASGAGKSTIADLLLRFVHPQAGRITIDGTDIATLPADVLYRSITLVSQDTYLFHGTIRDNLIIARPGADEAELKEALSSAGLASFVQALPQGLDTPVGERGERLSGGQRQRLAIARALLTGAHILVFDEATARLDGHTEQKVLETVAALPSDRTVLVIAHRLTAIRGADRIIVLDAGRIIQSGTHDELAADAAGRYTSLMRTQAST